MGRKKHTKFTREQGRMLDSIVATMERQDITLEEYAINITQKVFDYRDMYELEKLENKKLKGIIGRVMTELNCYRKHNDDTFIQARLH